MRRDNRRNSIVLVGSLTVLLVSLLPILETPFFGDDVPNSQRTAVLKWTNQSVWDSITSGTYSWMVNEGRFFPVGVIENTLLFDSVHSRWIYKLIQLSLTVLVSCLIGCLIYLVSKSIRASLLSMIIFGATLQTRNWYDPTIGFGLLLQSVTIKVLLSAILLLLCIRNSRNLLSAIYLMMATLLWIAALLQYEIVLFVFPGLLFLYVLDGRGQIAKKILMSMALVLPTFALLIYVRHLRVDASPTGAYTINLDLKVASLTFMKQLSGVFPLSNALFLDGRPIIVKIVSDWQMWFLITVVTSAICLFGIVSYKGNAVKLLRLSIFGFILTTCPAITTSLSVRWQQEISWGLPYLSIFVQYVGITIIGVCVCEAIFRKMRLLPSRLKFLLSFPIVFLFVFANVFNFENNKSVAEEIKPLRSRRELFEDSIRARLLEDFSDEVLIFSPEADNNSWTNSHYTAWLGGPSKNSFVKPDSGLLDVCKAEKSSCDQNRQWLGLVTISSTSDQEVLAIGELAKTNTNFLETELVPASIRVVSRNIGNLPSLCRKNIDVRKEVVFANCSELVRTFSKMKD